MSMRIGPHLSKLLVLLACTIAVGLFVGAACRTTVDSGDAGSGPGSGVGPLTCESVEDCPDPSNYDCLGICLQRCAADAVCKLDEYCSARGYCERGCRDSTTCEDGQVCVAGTCQSTDAAGACGTKCDCAPGQVCRGGVCQDPPEQCNGPDDCGRGPGDRCEAYQCNGFTNQCFDPDPQPCTDATDCIGRPGCQDGCLCTPNGQCVPDGECTPENEAEVCGDGFYCTADLTCGVLPSCTSNTECEAYGLVCNLGRQRCQRPAPCDDNADCTSAPATYCNTASGSCEVPSCRNGGVQCGVNEQCSTDGRCVPQGTGTACTSDAQCPNDPWPNTQYCSFASGQGECTIGCRSNASCPQGQVCNGARACVSDSGGGGGGGQGQWGDSCTSDADCQAGLICGLFTGTCAELCFPPCSTCTGGSCCSLSGQPYCSLLGFCWPTESSCGTP